MVQYNKIIKSKKKGFTLVELMVVLAITAILAALVGGGLMILLSGIKGLGIFGRLRLLRMPGTLLSCWR